jgi:hypothetical protein
MQFLRRPIKCKQIEAEKCLILFLTATCIDCVLTPRVLFTIFGYVNFLVSINAVWPFCFQLLIGPNVSHFLWFSPQKLHDASDDLWKSYFDLISNFSKTRALTQPTVAGKL